MSSTSQVVASWWQSPGSPYTSPLRGTIRRIAMVGLALAVVLGCSGWLTGVLFQQKSPARWMIAAATPALLLFLMLSGRAATYCAAGVVISLPFTPLYVTVHGVTLVPVLLLIGFGVLVTFLARDRGAPLLDGQPASRGHLVTGVAVAALLLLQGALRGIDPGSALLQASVVASLGYLICRASKLDPQAPSFVLAAFAGTVGIQAVIAVSEFKTGHRFNPYGGGVAAYDPTYFFNYEGVIRPSGAFFDPISLGNVLAITCPMMLVMACRAGQPLVLRLLYVGCLLGSAGALVLTLSRMSWIGAAAGVVVVLVLSPLSERVRQVGLVAGSAVVISATAVALAGPRLLLRFASIFHPTSTGTLTANGDKARQEMWQASFELFAQHPFFGVGAGNLHPYLVEHVGGVGLFAHAHSTYLQNLAESGLLGALAILAIGYATFRDVFDRLRASNREDTLARCCAGAAVALAVAWTTDYTVRYTAVLACMAVPFILLAASQQQSATPAAVRSRTSRVRVGVGRPGQWW